MQNLRNSQTEKQLPSPPVPKVGSHGLDGMAGSQEEPDEEFVQPRTRGPQGQNNEGQITPLSHHLEPSLAQNQQLLTDVGESKPADSPSLCKIPEAEMELPSTWNVSLFPYSAKLPLTT